MEVPLHYVENDDDQQQLLTWLNDNLNLPLSIDTETEGLQPFGPKRHKVRLFQVGSADEGWAVPFKGNERFVQRVVDLVNRSQQPLAHNAVFDEFMLQEEGIDTGAPWHDTYIMHHLAYPKHYHGLKPAGAQLIGREIYAPAKWLDKVFEKEHLWWDTIPLKHPAYWKYAAFDPVATCRIHAVMMQERSDMLSRLNEQYERERLLARLTSEQSRAGLRVDVPYAVSLIDKWDAEAKVLAKRLERYKIESPHSAKQISNALVNEGWEPDVFTETGQICTNKAVLEGLDHEIAEAVLRWRRIHKWTKSYAIPMAESGGRIYPNISSLRAATGRESVAEPPLQQLPKGPEVRRAILAEEGEVMYAIDYTGQEMRLTCAFAQDPVLTKAVLNGEDVHGRVASVLHGPNYTKEQRQWTKNAIYAYAYGAGGEKLATTAHAPVGAFEKAVSVAYPGLAAFTSGVLKVAERREKQDGLAWAKTLGGRIVAVSSKKHYALTNYIMQGSGADAVKMAHQRVDEADLSDRVILKIHDELLCSLPVDTAAAEAEQIRQLMEFEFRGIPFEAHATGPGANWGDVA